MVVSLAGLLGSLASWEAELAVGWSVGSWVIDHADPGLSEMGSLCAVGRLGFSNAGGVWWNRDQLGASTMVRDDFSITPYGQRIFFCGSFI